MQLTTLGPRGFKKTLAAATATFTALQDRSAYVRDIQILNSSADDTWTLTIQQTQKWVVPVRAGGNNQVLGVKATTDFVGRTLFRWAREHLGIDLSFPIPQGQTLTIASTGGATADILMSYEERSVGDATGDQLNGQNSVRNILPIFLTPGTTAQTSGTSLIDFDGQIAPSGFPKLYGDVNIPANFTLSVIAFFLEAMGINTFSGAADHKSNTLDLVATYSGQQLFSRDANAGIPMVGEAAASGSANTVLETDLGPYPAFQTMRDGIQSVMPMPLVLRGGSDIHFQLAVTGDATGTADYDAALVGMLVDANYAYVSPV